MAEQDTTRILEEWATRLAAELGLDRPAVDIDAILGLAGVAAHAVVRPAAPVTTYLVGYAAGLAAAAGTDGPHEHGTASTPHAGALEAARATATATASAREYAAEHTA